LGDGDANHRLEVRRFEIGIALADMVSPTINAAQSAITRRLRFGEIGSRISDLGLVADLMRKAMLCGFPVNAAIAAPASERKLRYPWTVTFPEALGQGPHRNVGDALAFVLAGKDELMARIASASRSSAKAYR
jgi:hypothetical protein